MFVKRHLYSPFFYILLILVGYFSFTKLIDLDLGFHLAQGKYFFENNFTLPKTEIFSFSVYGQPNIIISWLFDVLFYGTYLLGNFWALSFWKSITVVFLVTLFIFRLSYLISSRKLAVSQFFIYAAAALFLISTFNWVNIERPHVLGYVFLSLFLLIFEMFRENPKKWHWAAFLLIQILWANTHTSFASGIAFTGIFGSGLLLEFFLQKYYKKDKSYEVGLRKIWQVGLLMMLQTLVSLINPYGIFIYLNVLKASFSPNLHLIKELWPMTPEEFLTPRGIFFFLAFIPMARFIQRRDFKMILTYAAFLVLGFRTGRLFFDFIIFSAPFTFVEIFALLRSIFNKSKIGIVVFLIALFSFIGGVGQSFAHGYGISENTLPVRVADFILEKKISGPMYNSYGLGSYLIWKLYPHYQVYIDGRAPVYDQKEKNIITEYYAILGDVGEWKKAVEKYNFNMAVVDWPFTAYGKIYNTTEKNMSSDEWAPVFFDTEGILYLRRNEINKTLIDQYGYKYINPQQLDPSYLQKYMTSRELFEEIVLEFQRAIRDNPTNYRAYFMNAAFWAQTPTPPIKEIIANLKKSLDLNPQFEQARDILEQNYGVIQ